MNYIDIVIGLLLLFGIIAGWRQGFIRQLFGLLALFLGVYCAYKFSHFAAHYITLWFETDQAWTNAFAFAVTFVFVLVGVVVVGRLADRFIKMVALGWLNRFLGIILSLLQIALIIGICLVILDVFDILPEKQVQRSYLYAPMENLGTRVFPYLQRLIDLF